MNLRDRIIKEAKSFFGSEIIISEKALQVLEYTYELNPNPLDVFYHANRLHPPFFNALSSLGIQLDERRFQPFKRVQKEPAGSIGDLLKSLFKTRGIHGGKLVPTAKAIKTSKCLTLHDILVAPFESIYSINVGKNAPRGKCTNDVVDHVLQSINKDYGRAQNIEIERFCSQIVSQIARIKYIDPFSETQQFVLFYNGKNYEIRPFAGWDGFLLDDKAFEDGALWHVRGNVFQPIATFSEEALEHLNNLINRNAPEKYFQDFFTKYPEFLLVLGDFRRVHSQLVLSEDGGSSYIPDFFVERLDSDLCDLIELKRTDHKIYRRQRNRDRFMAIIYEAIAQVASYRNWFDDKENREEFFRIYGLKLYRPNVVIIIGRDEPLDEVNRVQIHSEMPGWLEIKTYDQVLMKVKEWKRLFF
jgi:hypothetical protein